MTKSTTPHRSRRRRWQRFGKRLFLLALGMAIGMEVFGFMLRHTTLSLFDFFKLEWPKREFTDPHSLKILAVGDSFTYGIASERISEFLVGYPEMLPELLASETASVEVINLAYPASDSGSAVDRFRRFLKKPASYPDVVLLAFGINNIGFAKFIECRTVQAPTPPPWSAKATAHLYAHSIIFRVAVLMGSQVFGGAMPSSSVDDIVHTSADGTIHWDDPLAEKWVKTCLQDDFSAALLLCRQARARPVIVTYHQDSFATQVQRFVAETHGADLVDVAHTARNMDPDLLARFKAKGRWHPDFCGYVAVAKLVADRIAQSPPAQKRGFRVKTYAELLPYLRGEMAKEKKTDTPCILARDLWLQESETPAATID